MNTLEIIRILDHGAYLDAEDLGEVLLPKRDLNPANEIGDHVKVFIYFDSDDKIIATTKTPKAQVGEFASLRVADVSKVGAFLDWGLPKDLLVPFQEQKTSLHEGQYYTVYLYLDRVSQRIVASTKLDKFISTDAPPYTTGEQVDLLVAAKTDLGYKTIINHSHWGLIFKDAVFKPLKIGFSAKGYIKKVRPDGKIDLSLRPPGKTHLDAVSQKIMDRLEASNGFLPMTDRTAPEEIYEVFGVSKKVFKRTLGALYKQRLILLEPKGIRLTQS
jgi:predicted RNA-binding protein (virulence factor B family)